MAYNRQHKEVGIDTTQTIGGWIGAGWHRVRIDEVRDMKETVVLLFKNDFNDQITDRVFVSGLDDKNYSKKMSDLLSLMPDEIIKEVVDDDYFGGLEDKRLRIKVERSDGNYIRKMSNGFVIVGVGPEVYKTHEEAAAVLNTVGNKAYLRVVAFEPEEKEEPKGVW